jgi:hypothetical protein
MFSSVTKKANQDFMSLLAFDVVLTKGVGITIVLSSDNTTEIDRLVCVGRRPSRFLISGSLIFSGMLPIDRTTWDF